MMADRVELDDPEQDSQYFAMEESIELAFRRSSKARKKRLVTEDEN